MDTFSAKERSRIMALVRSTNTKPEMVVRKLVYSLGYRYRLHRRDLPGCPDVVFPSKRKVLFVHGCFWHQHRCKRGSRIPSSRREYWVDKLQRNVVRDRRVRRNLHKRGWSVLVVWECQTRSSVLDQLVRRVVRFLDSD
ncbi:MAG: very short patch repair endonuclease [Phycisphaerae bacterium]